MDGEKNWNVPGAETNDGDSFMQRRLHDCIKTEEDSKRQEELFSLALAFYAFVFEKFLILQIVFNSCITITILNVHIFCLLSRPLMIKIIKRS